ncbi:transient receptor potential cation channel subfamily V member 5-like [Narcine bancroftii]|uniref:transient receptor potential cation channel subfamily V member 5-like n=1 Tax=Narcine bancroftii TaxID=1343680 RepID=UPI00383154D3
MFAKMTNLLSKHKITIRVDPVITDPNKESELHKAALKGDSELIALLSTKNFNVNQGDYQGRTALHIAAAMNNLDAVVLLLKKNVHIDEKTLGDGQSAIHHAAKHNATRTLLYLCQHGANIQSRDFQLRTPLFLAAEYGHQDSAKILLDYGADIKSLDSSGQSILSLMMVNMPTVAEEGLNQFYSYSSDTLKTQYYLKPLEPFDQNTLKSEYSRRPVASYSPWNKVPACPASFYNSSHQVSMQFIVWCKLNNLVRHPVIKKFVDIKWKMYGHMEALTLLVANTVFFVSWFSFLYLFSKERIRFTDFRKEIWIFLLVLFCITEVLYLIILDINEYFGIKYIFRQWQQQQQESIEYDLKFCSPALPQEEALLKKRLERLIKMKPFYQITYWRLINWFYYVLLLLIFFILIANMMVAKKILGNNDQRLVAIIIVPLWLLGLKHFQVLSYIGPFVLMLYKIIVPVLKYLFIFCEMFIAFAIAFWFIFTGNSQQMKTSDSLIFAVFQVTIIHHYGYAEFHEIDPIMTNVLVCMLIFGSIICNNLFIGMLTKGFSRAQDEISTKLTMERLAILVKRDKSWLFYFDHQAAHYFICKQCMPLIVQDDVTVASFLKGAFVTITKQLHDIEVFLKTRMMHFKGIGGIRKRKEEEQNLIAIEQDLNVLQNKLMKMASLREKKNQLLFLHLQIIFCLLQRMKVSSEPTNSKQDD